VSLAKVADHDAVREVALENWMGPGNHVLDCQNPPCQGTNYEGEKWRPIVLGLSAVSDSKYHSI